MEPVFEIREYLDEAGQTVGSEVVDISKEMEMMRQFEAQLDPQALDAAVVDDDMQFVRDLALLTDAERDDKSNNDESVGDIFVSVVEAEAAASTDKPNAQKTLKSDGKASSGWKKGFLSNGGKKSPVKNMNQASNSETKVWSPACEPASIDCHNSSNSTSQFDSDEAMHLSPTVATSVSVKTDTGQRTEEATQSVAFSGIIVERFP